MESVKSSILEYRTDQHYKDFVKQADDLIGNITSHSSVFSRPVRKNRGRSTLLNDFVVEESLGERTDEATEMKSLFFRDNRCYYSRIECSIF